MTFTELTSPDELTEFLNSNSTEGCVITFSASWCGPCKASKPRLKELADSSDEDRIDVPVGYVLEEDLDDFLDIFVVIKSFPTYIFFRDGKEVARVEGVDFDALLKMVDENKQQ
mmetsp:Transcript_16441/g.40108  ORF Transcript_16441/g.40108 Transcript_16441/m.40108 type:complete len:114 (-) Transcript_16441:160-501(-)